MRPEAAGSAQAAPLPAVWGEPPENASAESPAGLAHVAAVSFLASRATPTGGFWVALAGGVALARAGERHGTTRGFGASLAAMLQSIAIIGPARLGVPLTQALSAPVLGGMEARGRGTLAQILVCAAIRTVQNAIGAAFFIGVVTGLDAYAASYDRVLGGLLSLPEGSEPALLLTGAGLLVWSAFASTMQVLVYRRGLESWRRGSAAAAAPGAAPPSDGPAPAAKPEPSRRFDPRAVTVAAAVAFGLLLASTEWALIAGVFGWLVVASVAAARLDRDVIPAGLVLAAVLAGSALVFGLVGGLGVDLALRRCARAGLLVLVATWLRAAVGSEGLREVARRTLRRLRRIPSLDEASDDLEQVGTTPRLAASGRALIESVKPVRKRPLPFVDAVLGWVRLEAARFKPAAAAARPVVRLRARDAVLLALAALPAAALI